MDYQAREIVILKDDEFLLMLAASGIEKWYGIDLNETNEKPESEREFNYKLASLYRKQIVDWTEEKAEIAESYKPLFKALRDSAICIITRKSEKPEYAGGCYICGDNVVVVDKQTAAADEIELSMMSFEEWIDDLANSEFYPETAGLPGGEPEADGGQEMVSEFELRDVPDGNLIETMKLMEYGLYGIIQIESGEIIRREYFSADRVAEVLMRWRGAKA